MNVGYVAYVIIKLSPEYNLTDLQICVGPIYMKLKK